MKFRITQVVVTEYEVHSELYEGETPEEMLAVDVEAVMEDPAMFMFDEETTITVTGDIINEEEN